LKKIIIFFIRILFVYLISTTITYADLQKNLINKILKINTLSFNFKQQIGDKKEVGKCVIKYPLLMKCDYFNIKQKVLVSNGRTLAIIKKKYKKIYLYPIKRTPLFIILDKNKIINLIKDNKAEQISSDLISFSYIEEGKIYLKILFDKNSLELRGWQTVDSYSNNVNFIIDDILTNKNFEDILFKIPKESEL